MASNFNFETRDERIERMHADNPGRPIELCVAVVDGIWDKKRELVESRIPERFRRANVDDLGPIKLDVIDAVEEMFEHPEVNETVGVIFCGPAGSGKTHAAYAVMNMFKEANPETIAYMTSYSQAINTLKTEYAHDTFNEMSSVWDRLTNESGMYGGVLMIDDVSSQKLTDFELDKLMLVLEKRFNDYMPFILTTNVKPEDFKAIFGERLASRLIGYCAIVEFSDRDKRLESDDLTQEAIC